jgi:hypothetical protein
VAELRQWGVAIATPHWLGGVIILPYGEDVARTLGTDSAAAIQRLPATGELVPALAPGHGAYAYHALPASALAGTTRSAA